MQLRISRVSTIATLALLAGVAAIASHVSAGQTTTITKLSHRSRLYDSAASGKDVYIVGYPGLVLRSSDHGKTLTQVSVPTKDALFSIDINKSGVGAIVGRGGLVLLTSDGGATWSKTNALADSKDGEDKPHLFAVDVLESGTIVAVGDFATIVQSTDKGKTWERRSFDATMPVDESEGERDEHANEGFEEEARLTGVAFGDNMRGFVVGEFGMVLASEDGGQTWKRQRGATDQLLFSVAVENDKHALAAGSDGTIVETVDGATWKVVPSATRNHLFGIWTWNGVTLAVGADGAVVRRDSASGEFKVVPTNVHTWLSSVALHDASHGVIVGGLGHILKTDNAGQSFSVVTGE